MSTDTYNELVKQYNMDQYHYDFLDSIAPFIPDNLLGLYLDTLNLSFKAPYSDEMNQSYQITIEILCKSLGFNINQYGDLY